MAIRLSRRKQFGSSSEKLGEDGMGRSLPAHFVMLNDKIPLFCNPTQAPCCLGNVSSKMKNGICPVKNFEGGISMKKKADDREGGRRPS